MRKWEYVSKYLLQFVPVNANSKGKDICLQFECMGVALPSRRGGEGFIYLYYNRFVVRMERVDTFVLIAGALIRRLYFLPSLGGEVLFFLLQSVPLCVWSGLTLLSSLLAHSYGGCIYHSRRGGDIFHFARVARRHDSPNCWRTYMKVVFLFYEGRRNSFEYGAHVATAVSWLQS